MLQASVIVATRNRADILDDCLSHLAVQDLPRDCYEVLIVDNGSTDNTQQVASRWAARSQVFRYCSAPVAGLSLARNVGIEAARSDLVAFVDDDARATAAWLRAIISGYERRADVVGVGGPVELSYLRDRPWWLTLDLETWYSALDLGDAPVLLAADEALSGANMSFRRSKLVDAGGFPTDLGRVGTSLLSNEETKVQADLRSAGGLIAYEPLARVAHVVHNDRLTLRWLLARTLAQGQSDFVQERHGGLLASRGEVLRAVTAAGRSLAVGGWRGDLKRLSRGEPSTLLVDSLARRSRDAGYVWTGVRSLTTSNGVPR